MKPSFLRPARVAEAHALSALARRAKASWGYPPERLAQWRDELTISPALFDSHRILVLELQSQPVAVIAWKVNGERAEIEHLWVEPEHMGQGAGRVLFVAARDDARARGARVLVAVSDPNAAGFYERMGARHAGDVPSRPAGRLLPEYQLELTP